jgi:hypothetical protein
MIRLPGVAIAALASLALLPAPAKAYTFMSGADLAQRCLVDRADPAQVGNFSFCVGYIRATFERMWVAEMEAGRRPQECLPAEMTNQQIIDAVFAEMQRNPPGNDILASQVVRHVLKAISPGCFS